MELKKEYFFQYKPSLWFRIKNLFAKTFITKDVSKDGDYSCQCKYKIIGNTAYIKSIKRSK